MIYNMWQCPKCKHFKGRGDQGLAILYCTQKNTILKESDMYGLHKAQPECEEFIPKRR